MPADLRAHSEVSLELNNGSDVGRFSLKRHSEFSQLVSFSNVSIRYRFTRRFALNAALCSDG